MINFQNLFSTKSLQYYHLIFYLNTFENNYIRFDSWMVIFYIWSDFFINNIVLEIARKIRRENLSPSNIVK